MAYSFSTRKGNGETVKIPVSSDLTGATLAVEFSKKRDFPSVLLTKTATAGTRTVNVTLTAADVDAIGDAFFRVKLTKDGKSRFIQDGRIDYQAPVALATESNTVSSAGGAVGPWEDIVRAAQFGYSHTAGVAGDSTGDNLSAFEWPLITLKLLSTKYPNVRMEHYGFNDATQTYGAPTVVNAGAAATGGVIAHDTFSVAGNAVGAAADTKGTWAGWGTVTKSGGRASLANNTSGLSVLCPTQDSTVTSKVLVTTAGLTGFNAFRFGNGFSNALMTGFGVHLNLSLNGQWITYLTMAKTLAVGGVQVVATEQIDLGLANVTNKAVEVETSLSGLTFSAKITVEGREPVIRSFNLTAQEKSEIGFYAGVAANPGNLAGGLALDEVKVETEIIPTPTIKLYNGSVAGKNPDYLRAPGRLAAMFPVSLDSVFLSFSHNGHLNQGGPAAFPADYKQTIDLIKVAHPKATIYLGSQNPEFSPRDASMISTHAARQALIPQIAKDNGARYVPVLEAFVSYAADNGRALVQADGVHPTNPSTIDPTDGFGSTLWARTVTGIGAGVPVHTHPAAELYNSTAVGRALITATDAAAARTAISAGTSSLSLGTAGNTAAAGNDFRFFGFQSNTQTVASYTLVLTDARKVIEMNNSAANTVVVPTNATAGFAVGTVIDVMQLGTGATTIAPATGVTLRAPGGLKIADQFGSIRLRKRATDEWVAENISTPTSFVPQKTINFFTENTTLVGWMAGRHLQSESAGAITFTIPTNATSSFPIGIDIDIVQGNVGEVIIAPAAGVNLRSREGANKLAGRYSAATLRKIGADTWQLHGDIVS